MNLDNAHKAKLIIQTKIKNPFVNAFYQFLFIVSAICWTFYAFCMFALFVSVKEAEEDFRNSYSYTNKSMICLNALKFYSEHWLFGDFLVLSDTKNAFVYKFKLIYPKFIQNKLVWCYFYTHLTIHISFYSYQ